MENLESLIAGSEKLTRIYGGWPSFHDAEVIELNHWRGRIKPGEWDDSCTFPLLTVRIHIFIESPDSHHTLATLRFVEVDDYRMEGFNHQNSIYGLSITAGDRGPEESGKELPPALKVEFQSAFGMGASFSCGRIEVVDAVPCTDEGTAIDTDPAKS